jgi:protein O-GlcNAc transferase
MESLSRTLYAACPLCESKDLKEHGTWDCRSHPLWKQPLPWTIRWMSCTSCGHVFTDGYFEGEALGVLMSSGQQNQQVQVSEQERFFASQLIDKVVAPQEPFVLPSPSWLDVGFGSGALVMTAQEFGYDVMGLDLRKANVDALHSLGYPARQDTIENHAKALNPVDAIPGSRYNVISMLDVLEHMPFC